MADHESWCCRSPLSPCAQDGGCSGSCNCGADESLESMPGAWRMWAHRFKDMLIHIGDRRYAELYAGSDGAVVEVDVIEVADDGSATHWAWLPTDGDAPQFAQPRRDMLEMCFHYGSQVEVDRGKGCVIRLAVTEVARA